MNDDPRGHVQRMKDISRKKTALAGLRKDTRQRARSAGIEKSLSRIEKRLDSINDLGGKVESLEARLGDLEEARELDAQVEEELERGLDSSEIARRGRLRQKLRVEFNNATSPPRKPPEATPTFT